MATFSDRIAGAMMMLVAAAVLCYYTAWVMVLPFVDEDHLVHGLFLPWWWAIALPSILLLVVISLVGAFVGVVMLHNSRKDTKSHHD